MSGEGHRDLMVLDKVYMESHQNFGRDGWSLQRGLTLNFLSAWKGDCLYWSWGQINDHHRGNWHRGDWHCWSWVDQWSSQRQLMQRQLTLDPGGSMITTERINSQLSCEKVITSACEKVITSPCEKAIASAHENVIASVSERGKRWLPLCMKRWSPVHAKVDCWSSVLVVSQRWSPFHVQSWSPFHTQVIDDQHRDDPQRSALWVYHDALWVILCPVHLNFR